MLWAPGPTALPEGARGVGLGVSGFSLYSLPSTSMLYLGWNKSRNVFSEAENGTTPLKGETQTPPVWEPCFKGRKATCCGFRWFFLRA